MISRRRFLKMGAALAAAAPAVFLTGCAHPQLIDPGSTEEQVIAKLGQPHARTAMPDGTVRLTYSYQPMGQAVWWMFLDASGRLVRVEHLFTALASGGAVVISQYIGRQETDNAGEAACRR